MQKIIFFKLLIPQTRTCEVSLLDSAAGVCCSVCKKAAVCAAVGKLGTAQLGTAQSRTELTALSQRAYISNT